MSILELQGVCQEFGGLRALDAVDLAIAEKTIFGIIGPNGAGKTTLFNIITGIYTPVQGQVVFKDKVIHRLPPYAVARLGIGRTFQNIRLFNKMSVLDNVRVGSHGASRSGLLSCLLGLPGERREEKNVRIQAERLLELVGMQDKAQELAENLSYGEQRKLEIARALALEPALLLLDEPAAGMTMGEKSELTSFIRFIRDEQHLTVVLVEHDMNLVMNLCDRIAVLDYGVKIAEGAPEEIKADQRVIQSYLGVEA